MKPEEVALQPGWVAAVEVIATEAQDNGEYPEIFEDDRLAETVHRVVQATGLPRTSKKEFRNTERDAAYHIGQYMRQHEL